MILKTTVQLDEDDFTTTDQHPDNTVLVTIEGRGAAKTPLRRIKEFLQRVANNAEVDLAIEDIKHHYRGEEPCRVYFPLPDQIDRQLFHTKALTHDGITYRAYIPDRIPKKVFLNYVPPTITDTGLQKLTSTFISPDKIHQRHKNINGRLDRHLIIAEIDNDDNIPHFLELIDNRTMKTFRIPVTIPGRLPLCAECGKPEHYASQCPTKRQQPETTTTTTTTDLQPQQSTTSTTTLPTASTEQQPPTNTKRPFQTSQDDSPTHPTKRQQTTQQIESDSSEPELIIDETASTPVGAESSQVFEVRPPTEQHDELKTHPYKIDLSRLEEFRTIVHSYDFSFVSEEPCPKDDNCVEGAIRGPRQNSAKLGNEIQLWCKKN